jgi:hypothetical protein
MKSHESGSENILNAVLINEIKLWRQDNSGSVLRLVKADLEAFACLDLDIKAVQSDFEIHA